MGFTLQKRKRTPALTMRGDDSVRLNGWLGRYDLSPRGAHAGAPPAFDPRGGASSTTDLSADD